MIIGDSAVGKSSLLDCFVGKEFKHSHLTTLGLEYKTKVIDYDNKKVRMQIYDTAG